MARILNRPMFRRGGSTGGITANLKKPRMGFEPGGKVPDFQQILSQYMQAPEEPKGLTTSDYLRLAAAGAEIMGAQPTSDGSGFLAALSSAGPALSGAATDIASNISARKENFRDRQAAYDAAMGQAAVDQASAQFTRDAAVQDRDAGFQQDKDMLQLQFDYDKQLQSIEAQNAIDLLKEEKKLSPYDFEKEYVDKEGQKLIEEAIAAIEADDRATYEQKKSQFLNGLYGESTRANTEEKANLLADADFLKAVRLEVDAIMEPGGSASIEGNKYSGKTREQVREMVLNETFGRVISEIYFPEFKAEGGRVGMQEGGMAANPNMREGASSADIQLTFTELRKRLPPEVSDGVINLIMNSEQAMIDFAQLMTPEDIAVFNDKYNVDLQYPTQVA
tara:strand:+ start:797 stop:1972 length:1176 start_codon:yes stop_codon:yes gene_type:complete